MKLISEEFFNEIIERLDRMADTCVYKEGCSLRFIPSLDDGIALHTAIEILGDVKQLVVEKEKGCGGEADN